MLGVAALIQPPDDQPQNKQARENDSHDFQQHEHHISDLRPIACKVLSVYEKRKERFRLRSEALKVRWKQNTPIHHRRILRNGRHNIMLYSEQRAEVIPYRQPEVLDGFSETKI